MPAQRAAQRIALAHVPVGDELVAVGIGVRRQHDDVAQEAHASPRRTADELVDGFDQLLRAEHFVGVQPAVDPDDRLALGGERARLRVGQALGEGQAARDVPVAIEPPQVLGRRDDGHPLRAALFGPADVHESNPIRLGAPAASSSVSSCE